MTTRFFALILGAILLAVLTPFIINPESLARRNGDFSDLVWPDYFFIKQSILKFHQVPFWNPTVFSGIPEIASPQSPLIYPPNILALILPIDLAIVFLFFGHALVGGIFFFKLVRERLNWMQLSSIAATMAFVFSPFFWAKMAVGHLSQIFAIFLTAPILYFGLAFLQSKRWRYLFLTVLVMALQYLNYPTIWYFTNLFTTLFLLGIFLQKIWKWNLQVFLSPFLSLIFIAPIFLLQLQAGPLITRSILNIHDLAIPIWSFSRFFKSILVPSNFIGDIETEVWLYPSLIALSLAIFGFLKLKKNYQLILGLLVALILLITLGGRTPIFAFLTKYLPGFSYLRVSTRDWFVFIILISFLTGFGLEKIPSKFKKIAFWLLVGDLIFFSSFRIWSVPEVMKPQNSLNLNSLFQSSTEYRTYCTSRCLSARDFLPAGVITADGYHLLILKDYRITLSQAGGFSPPEYTGNLPTYNVSDAQPLADALGEFSIKWVISNHQLTDQNFKPVRTEKGFTLFENQQTKKRFYFRRKEDENQTHFLNKDENLIEVVKDTPNQIILKTSGEADTLVVADSFYPGWEAYIDQKQVTIKKQDGWARAIEVSKGTHQVEFIFRPFNHLLSKI